MHDLGPSLSAFNAFQLLQGIETLDLRVARHSESALASPVSSSSTPRSPACTTRASSRAPGTRLRSRTSRAATASVFSFDLHTTGDPEEDFREVEAFISRLGVVRLVANIGDARSLVAHPASMTHSHCRPTQLAEAGIAWTTVRLSIGLEDMADIIADLDGSLSQVRVPELEASLSR